MSKWVSEWGSDDQALWALTDDEWLKKERGAHIWSNVGVIYRIKLMSKNGICKTELAIKSSPLTSDSPHVSVWKLMNNDDVHSDAWRAMIWSHRRNIFQLAIMIIKIPETMIWKDTKYDLGREKKKNKKIENTDRYSNQKPNQDPSANRKRSLTIMLIFEQAWILQSSERLIWRHISSALQYESLILVDFGFLFRFVFWVGMLERTSHDRELCSAEDGVGVKVWHSLWHGCGAEFYDFSMLRCEWVTSWYLRRTVQGGSAPNR